jgi:hypothetical protein
MGQETYMDKIKKHAVWVILVAIIVGLFFLFKARKVAAEPIDTALISSTEAQPARPIESRLAD